MQPGQQIHVVAPSGSYWTGVIAQNAGVFQRVTLPADLAAGRTARARIRALAVISEQNLAWEFWFWRNKKGQVAPLTEPNVNAEHFAGFWAFSANDGKQIGATGAYYYYVDGLDILYEDQDAGVTVEQTLPQSATGYRGLGQLVEPGAFLNVTLVNRSAVSKSAGSVFRAVFILEPTLGW